MKKLTIVLVVAVLISLAISVPSGAAPKSPKKVIAGRVWIFYDNHTWARWSGIEVKLEQNGQLVDTTISEYLGIYEFSNVHWGTYTLVGDVVYEGIHYHGTREVTISPQVKSFRGNLLLRPIK